MAQARERVMLITIRVALEEGNPPVIVAREHLLWPSSDDGASLTRSTVGARSDDVLAVVRDWMSEFVDADPPPS